MRWTRFLARLALVAVAGAAMTAAQAQTTGTIVGTIQDASNGNPISGALVIAQSPSLQGEQTALTSDEGTFRITLLPPGQYTVLVQADGYRPGQKKGIGIDIDKTIRVTLQLVPKALKAKEVVVRATAPVIDQGSTTSGAVINESFTKNVPTGTGFQSVLNVAPGATSDGLGTTFRGSSSPENNWIIDGVRTTDVANGNGGTGLPTFFVKQVEVKTGGYQAEYGQATGGVVNVVTRSGGNEFHGDAFVRFNSAALNAPGKTVKGTANVVNAKSQAGLNADFGFDLGGYIIKDKLWFFVGVVPHQATTNYTRTVTPAKFDVTANGGAGGYVYDAQGNQEYATDPISSLTKNLSFNALTIQRMAKLTWNVDENNSAQVSYFGDPGNGSGIVRSSLNGDLASISQDIGAGNQDLAVRWTSKLFNKKMLVKAWYGLHYETSNALPVKNAAYYKDNPIATIHMDQSYVPADFQNVPGCSITYTPTGGPNAGTPTTAPLCNDYLYYTGPYWYQNKNTMTRNAANIGFTNFFDLAGHNELKYGADFQQNRYLNEYGYTNLYAQRDYSNSRGYIRRQSLGDAVMDANGNVTGWTPRGFRVADGRTFDTGVYLQDSYSPIEGLAINPGVRWETQNIWGHNQTKPGVSITNNWAPRIGVTYDWTGTGRSKVEAYYGRFFESIPMDMNSRAFGGEVFAFQWLSPDGKTNLTPLLGLPTVNATNGSGGWYLLEDGSSDYVVPHLSGQYVDEFSGGVQYEVLPDLAVGATLVHRQLGRVIEDVSPDNGGTYILANPGDTGVIDAGTKTLETQLKADGGTIGQNPDGTPDYTCPASNTKCQTTLNHLNLTRGVAQFPAPIRNYDALELTVRKNFSNNWYLIGSLTFSRTYGNYPGLYTPGNGQLDPNITSLYDLPKLMVNRVGPLYNDRPVYFKLDGYYLWDFGLVTGVSLRAYSGRPINVLAADADYGSNETFLLPRGAGGRTPPLFNVDVNVGYQLKVAGDVKVSINANIFNLLDSQQTATVSNTFTYDVAYPVVGGQLSDIQDSKGNPTVKGPDGSLVTKNPDFMKVTATSQLQSPLAARLDLRVSF